MQVITQKQLVEMLYGMVGAKMATVITETEPSDHRKNAIDKSGAVNPYYKRTLKTQRNNVTLGFHYDEGVLRRLAKEGKDAEAFTAGTSWHEPVKNAGRMTPLCEHKTHKGEYYLRVMLNDTLSTDYRTTDGDPIDAAELAPFMPPKNGYHNQGLDKPLIITTYKVSGIRALTVNGTDYIVAQ